MNLAASWPAPLKSLPDIYPAQIGQLLLDSYGEVLGEAGLQQALRKAGLPPAVEPPPTDPAALPFEAPALLAAAVEEIHGEQTGRGLCLRAGRVMFRRGIRSFCSTLGLTDLRRRRSCAGWTSWLGFSTITAINVCTWRSPVRTSCL
jgi:hypothetical protein